jgi:hypothetical protein
MEKHSHLTKKKARHQQVLLQSLIKYELTECLRV